MAEYTKYSLSVGNRWSLCAVQRSKCRQVWHCCPTICDKEEVQRKTSIEVKGWPYCCPSGCFPEVVDPTHLETIHGWLTAENLYKSLQSTIYGVLRYLAHANNLALFSRPAQLVITSQAKLVSCRFNARRVIGRHFNCQTCSVLSKTMHAHCGHRHFLYKSFV